MTDTTINHGDVDMSRFRAHARDAAHFAAMRGLELPEYADALAIHQEAVRLRDEPQPGAQAPTNPKAVASWVADLAAKRVTHREQVQVARSLADAAERGYMRAALSAIPGFVAGLCAEFADLSVMFRRLCTEAPTQMSSHLTAEQVAAHQEWLRTADEMTVSAAWRLRFAEATGEVEDYKRHPLWLVLDPGDDVSMQRVTDALGEFLDRLPSTAGDWQALLDCGPSMAPYQAVSARVSRFGEATYAGGMAPDGGMQDKTIGEALSFAGTHVPAAHQHTVA